MPDKGKEQFYQHVRELVAPLVDAGISASDIKKRMAEHGIILNQNQVSSLTRRARATQAARTYQQPSPPRRIG